MSYFVHYWDGLPGDGNAAFEEFASEAEAVAYINARIAELPAADRWAGTSPGRCIVIEGQGLELELVRGTDAVRVKRAVIFTPVAVERIAKGDIVELIDDMRHVRPLSPARLAERKVDVGGIALDSFDVGEVATFDVANEYLRKAR